MQTERDRLSIDINPKEHRLIKMFATFHGETIREYVIECIRERLRRETEAKELQALTKDLGKDPVLRELWDNKKDAGYDKL